MVKQLEGTPGALDGGAHVIWKERKTHLKSVPCSTISGLQSFHRMWHLSTLRMLYKKFKIQRIVTVPQGIAQHKHGKLSDELSKHSKRSVNQVRLGKVILQVARGLTPTCPCIGGLTISVATGEVVESSVSRVSWEILRSTWRWALRKDFL